MGRSSSRSPTRRDFLVASATSLAAAAAAAAVASRSSSRYPRTVRDATGAQVRLPAPPERIVISSDYTALDSLLALGRPPLAAVRMLQPDWPWSARAGAGGVALLKPAASGEPPYDDIADHRPDLLFHLRGDRPEIVDRLGRIAPVVQYNGDDARAGMRVVAAALDLADQAEIALAGLADRLEVARGRIRGDGRAGWTFATFIVFRDGSAGYFGADKDASYLLPDLGLRPNLMTARTDGWASLGPDLMAGLDADVVLGRREEDGLDGVLERFEDDPAFRAIPAVARGHYHRLTLEQSWALGASSVLSWPVAADGIAEIIRSLPP